MLYLTQVFVDAFSVFVSPLWHWSWASKRQGSCQGRLKASGAPVAPVLRLACCPSSAQHCRTLPSSGRLLSRPPAPFQTGSVLCPSTSNFCSLLDFQISSIIMSMCYYVIPSSWHESRINDGSWKNMTRRSFGSRSQQSSARWVSIYTVKC